MTTIMIKNHRNGLSYSYEGGYDDDDDDDDGLLT